MNLPDRKKMSAKEYRERVKRIRRTLAAEVGGWPREQATPAARRERLARCEHDSFAFGRTYLPHYFTDNSPQFHYELVELLEPQGKDWVPVVVAAPRGFSKSTLVSFCYVMHQVLFGHRVFPILASDTSDLAEDLTSYLKLELEHNERIRSDFGERAIPEGADSDFTVGGRARILARGRGQRLRGFKHGPHRPDLFIGDDLENDVMVKNPRLVQDLLRWLTRVVMPGLTPKNPAVFIIGTIIATTSALAIMTQGKQEPFDGWIRRVYRALSQDADGKLHSLWPSRWPVKALLAEKKRLGPLGFSQEFMNDPRDEEGAFRAEWIDEHAFRLKDVPAGATTVGFMDPSISEKRSSDYKAIVVGAKDADGSILVIDAYVRRGSLDAAMQHAFAMNKQHHFSTFGVEDNLFQKLLLKMFTDLAASQGEYLPVRGVTHNTNKQARINSLSPGVERGLIRFPAPEDRTEDMRQLIEQLVQFPNHPHDDGPDALEGTVKLLSGSGVGIW